MRIKFKNFFKALDIWISKSKASLILSLVRLKFQILSVSLKQKHHLLTPKYKTTQSNFNMHAQTLTQTQMFSLTL